MKHKQIQDPIIRNAFQEVHDKLDKILAVNQLPQTASLSSVVDAINKITNSLKR